MVIDSSIEVPRPSAGDHVHTATRAIISTIPYVGGPAVEVFNALVTPPIQKRQIEWMETVVEHLEKLAADRGIRIEELKDNPVFIDTVFKASLAAIRTSQSEKLEALRNAVLNSALPDSPEAAMQEMFVGWIEDLTVWHVKILMLFKEPKTWFQQQKRQPPQFFSMGTMHQVIETAFPELRPQVDFYNQAWRDLYQRGLVNTPDVNTTMSADGAMAPRTTDWANSFLSFVRSPE